MKFWFSSTFKRNFTFSHNSIALIKRINKKSTWWPIVQKTRKVEDKKKNNHLRKCQNIILYVSSNPLSFTWSRSKKWKNSLSTTNSNLTRLKSLKSIIWCGLTWLSCFVFFWKLKNYLRNKDKNKKKFWSKLFLLQRITIWWNRFLKSFWKNIKKLLNNSQLRLHFVAWASKHKKGSSSNLLTTSKTIWPLKKPFHRKSLPWPLLTHNYLTIWVLKIRP